MNTPTTRRESRGFHTVKTTDQNLVAATPTLVLFNDADVFDPHNWHDPVGANPERIVVDEPGLYEIIAEVDFAAAAADVDLVEILIGGAAVANQSITQIAAGNLSMCTVATRQQLAAAAQITIRATSSGRG